jgi:hypothetical protein
MSEINHFLLVFDHRRDELIDLREFAGDDDSAVAAYSETESKYSTDPAIDIVLVGSDSLETVKVTHQNYFTGMSKHLMAEAMSIDF